MRKDVICVSAPGKIHLAGEHAVVYGKPDLSVAIDRRLQVAINNIKKKSIKIEADDKGFIKKALNRLVDLENKTLGKKRQNDLNWQIKIVSQIPINRGCASSAALASALSAAFLLIRGIIKKIGEEEKQIINEFAYEVEKLAHGTPSGVDNTCSVYGGFCWYRKEAEFLKTFKTLDLSIPKTFGACLIIDSGVANQSTREMVAYVRKVHNKRPKWTEKIFNNIEHLTKEILIAIKQENQDNFFNRVRLVQKQLERLGVVCDYAKSLVREVEKKGGVAKISGGGARSGKSFGILLCFHKNPKVIEDIGKKERLEVYPIKLSEEGVRVEQ